MHFLSLIVRDQHLNQTCCLSLILLKLLHLQNFQLQHLWPQQGSSHQNHSVLHIWTHNAWTHTQYDHISASCHYSFFCQEGTASSNPRSDIVPLQSFSHASWCQHLWRGKGLARYAGISFCGDASLRPLSKPDTQPARRAFKGGGWWMWRVRDLGDTSTRGDRHRQN